MNNLFFNKKRKEKVVISFLFLFIFLFSISFISAAPPVTTVQQLTTGYQILDSPQTVFKQGQDYQYNFFVTNLSNGALKLNDTTSCTFYLANSNGTVLFFTMLTWFLRTYALFINATKKHQHILLFRLANGTTSKY